MILAWTGRVVNLFGRAVVIVNSCGNPIKCYKCDGTAQASWQEQYFGMLNGETPMTYMEAVGISGLPEANRRVYYIVEKSVILAAWQIGRSVDDLLLPIRPFYCNIQKGPDQDEDDSKARRRKKSSSEKSQPVRELAGYQALMPGMFLVDPMQARRRYGSRNTNA